MGATMFTVQDERHQHYILASGKSNEVLLVLIHHAHVHLSLLSYYLLTRKQQQSKKQSKHSGSLHTKLRHSYMPLIKQTPNVFVISLEEKAFFSAGNKSFLSTFRNPTKHLSQWSASIPWVEEEEEEEEEVILILKLAAILYKYEITHTLRMHMSHHKSHPERWQPFTFKCSNNKTGECSHPLCL